MDIEKRFFELSKSVFCFDMEKYLNENNKIFLGIKINEKESCFQELFGQFPDDFLSIINKSFFVSEAGYKVNVNSVFPELNSNIDLFLLNSERLNDKSNKIEALIIHEICHLIIDSNSLDKTNLAFNDKTDYLGLKMYSMTDQENEKTTKHTRHFCNVLASASINAEPKDVKKRKTLVNSAMKYDMSGRI